jgi:hypothetical protein
VTYEDYVPSGEKVVTTRSDLFQSAEGLLYWIRSQFEEWPWGFGKYHSSSKSGLWTRYQSHAVIGNSSMGLPESRAF